MLNSAAQVYTRHNQLQRQEVGDTFEMPPAGMFRLHLRAEIVSAAGFEHSCLYVNWVLDLPPGWAAAQDTPLQVKIFVAKQKNICWTGCEPAVLDLGRGRRGALLSAGGGRPLLLHQPAGRGPGGGAAVAAAAAGGGELRRVRLCGYPECGRNETLQVGAAPGGGLRPRLPPLPPRPPHADPRHLETRGQQPGRRDEEVDR